ncbi:MAG: hypothetical protein EP338_11510 [Bacteroidetes bacterium]|nr:MAG: hypothetical protein EP338_11510 [Bacteroidota bacterium]
MPQTQNKLPITKRVRYSTMGSEKAKHLIYVLHGYGQLAHFFIRKFQLLEELGYYVVAPEGMHRFYLQGSSGRVGASWMTKEDRLTDIEDNLVYLDQLHRHITEQRTFESVSLLGFSQGGATAARWFGQQMNEIDHLILWACVFPDDMNKHFQEDSNFSGRKTFVLGSEDEYYNEQQGKELCAYYEGLKFSILLYEGTHNVDPETLKKIVEQ